MLRYLGKRLLSLVAVFFIVSILMFLLYRLIPGDPVRMMLDGSRASLDPERYRIMYEATRKKLGLDQPLPIQYLSWIGNLLKGEFGYSSVYRMEVSQLVAVPLKNTLLLNGCAFLLVFAITIPVGIFTAVKKNTILDHSIQVASVIGYSIPTFIVALLCIYILAIRSHLLPIGGMHTPGVTGNWLVRMSDLFFHMILPLLVMTISSLGSVIRYVRAAMIEVLQMDYIRTARAKGLPQRVVIYTHAFRNALIPVVTIVTSWFVGVFGGSVVVETIFGWNGIGKVLFEALKQQDYAVVLTMQMFYVMLSLLGNLIMDLGYCLVDPRIKL